METIKGKQGREEHFPTGSVKGRGWTPSDGEGCRPKDCSRGPAALEKREEASRKAKAPTRKANFRSTFKQQEARHCAD